MSAKDYMIEGICKDIICYLMEDYGLDMEAAMRQLYLSETFMKLQDEETGLYYQSSGYVYDYLQNEIRTGIVQ